MNRQLTLALIAACISAAWLHGQVPAPSFTAASVLVGSDPIETVVPGSGFTIYGHYLGPAEPPGCIGTPDYQHPQTPNPQPSGCCSETRASTTCLVA
jgi:hypothetical protein